jgi:hypothetical protein
MGYCEVCERVAAAVDIFIDNQGREIIACCQCYNRLVSGEKAEKIQEEKRREKRKEK